MTYKKRKVSSVPQHNKRDDVPVIKDPDKAHAYLRNYGVQISKTMDSNLFTMGVVAKIDPRRGLPEEPQLPSTATRLLRAQLILEEALETIQALGFEVQALDTVAINKETIKAGDVALTPNQSVDLFEIIDGCADTIYVATGTLAACGVADSPHLAEVCKCNDAKFPGGVAALNEHGKFQKPEGWVGPDHAAVMKAYPFNLKAISDAIVAYRSQEVK